MNNIQQITTEGRKHLCRVKDEVDGSLNDVIPLGVLPGGQPFPQSQDPFR